MPKLEAGREVIYKGRPWVVVEEFGTLVRIRRGDDTRFARVSEVRAT